MKETTKDPVLDLIYSLRLLARTTGLGLAETELLRLLVALSPESRSQLRQLAA